MSNAIELEEISGVLDKPRIDDAWDAEQESHYEGAPWHDERISVPLSRRDIHYILSMVAAYDGQPLEVLLDGQERQFIVAALKHWSHIFPQLDYLDLIGYVGWQASSVSQAVQALCEELTEVEGEGPAFVCLDLEALRHITFALRYSGTASSNPSDESYDDCFAGVDSPRSGKLTILLHRLDVLVDHSAYSNDFALVTHLTGFLSDEMEPGTESDKRYQIYREWVSA